jgi:ergothioneine biosynthesis protein EgtB
MSLAARYRSVRAATEAICAPLTIEEHVVQAFPDASPAKWHLAHTTWFFERFVLRELGVPAHHPQYDFLFNSYYEAVGPRVAREDRGKLARPSVEEVRAYRRHVDEQMLAAIDRKPELVELGLHHEQQHQELLLTDLKAAFACNPLKPPYRSGSAKNEDQGSLRFTEHDAGVREIGHDGKGFAFDNELPRHRVFCERFAIANRPITNGEYLAFMNDRGYDRADLWLSEGWKRAREWDAPLYWEKIDNEWMQFTLEGLRPLDRHAFATHLSHYEADAYARWAGARLPTEAEWELASPTNTGHVWEWTASAYAPYPGYRPLAGALGEYNGKFMSGQLVLRGGSFATPRDHIRPTYRNFFPPDARWQFTGVRLAK